MKRLHGMMSIALALLLAACAAGGPLVTPGTQRIGCGLHFDASCFGYLLRVREGARHRRVGYAGFECYVADTRLHGASE